MEMVSKDGGDGAGKGKQVCKTCSSDCRRIARSKVQKTIEDADGKEIEISFNKAGNYYYFQYMPFSSRSAWVAEQFRQLEELSDAKRQKGKTRINSQLAHQNPNSVKYPFDDDPFDSVRSCDLRHMVGSVVFGPCSGQ